MESTKYLNAVQLITSIGLIVGIILVIWELRQAREIAKGEAVVASFAQYSQRVQTMMGENSAAAVAKACDYPDELTTEEMLILDRYYSEVINNMRHTLLVQSVSDDLAVFDWTQWVGNFDHVFATEYGRWWWRNASWEQPIMDGGNAYLEAKNPPPCKDIFDGYRNRPATEEGA